MGIHSYSVMFKRSNHHCGLLFAAHLVLALSPASAAKWNVSAPTSVIIDSSTVPFWELSGITYLGPSETANHHRFVSVPDEGGQLIHLDVEISPTGSLVSARSTSSVTLPSILDQEGIVHTNPTRNSVFVTNENTPGIREYDLSTGMELQNVSIPAVFLNRRSNFGFESLARSSDGTTMWTANEEALTVDGPVSTTSVGTTVRIMKMNVTGNTVTPSEQFAYKVDPIHEAGILPQRRSGVSDLVALPDGTLLALERSFAFDFSMPLYYRSTITEVDFANATDVSQPSFSTGLSGKTYTLAAKEILWSGSAAGSAGQNLEGLTLGPRLANGNWLLVGVVDSPQDGSDPVSVNTLVTFELSPNKSADFDDDGDVDGRDFLMWQRGFGKPIGAFHADGDADRDGEVDANDLDIWQMNFGVSSETSTTAIPEPGTLQSVWAMVALFLKRLSQRR
jgi:hypothetical protein